MQQNIICRVLKFRIAVVGHAPGLFQVCGGTCGLWRLFTTDSSASYQRVHLQPASNNGRKMRRKKKNASKSMTRLPI